MNDPRFGSTRMMVNHPNVPLPRSSSTPNPTEFRLSVSMKQKKMPMHKPIQPPPPLTLKRRVSDPTYPRPEPIVVNANHATDGLLAAAPLCPAPRPPPSKHSRKNQRAFKLFHRKETNPSNSGNVNNTNRKYASLSRTSYSSRGSSIASKEDSCSNHSNRSSGFRFLPWKKFSGGGGGGATAVAGAAAIKKPALAASSSEDWLDHMIPETRSIVSKDDMFDIVKPSSDASAAHLGKYHKLQCGGRRSGNDKQQHHKTKKGGHALLVSSGRSVDGDTWAQATLSTAKQNDDSKNPAGLVVAALQPEKKAQEGANGTGKGGWLGVRLPRKKSSAAAAAADHTMASPKTEALTGTSSSSNTPPAGGQQETKKPVVVMTARFVESRNNLLRDLSWSSTNQSRNRANGGGGDDEEEDSTTISNPAVPRIQKDVFPGAVATASRVAQRTDVPRSIFVKVYPDGCGCFDDDDDDDDDEITIPKELRKLEKKRLASKRRPSKEEQETSKPQQPPRPSQTMKSANSSSNHPKFPVQEVVIPIINETPNNAGVSGGGDDDDKEEESSGITDPDYGVKDAYSFAGSDYSASTVGLGVL